MRRASFAAVLFFAASAAFASWYDDYDAGLDAVRKGQWQTVIQKMTAAINGNPKENDKARTYGAIFINYHPYYYRAAANLNLGRYEQAVSDFEKTSGPGPEDLGSIDTLMQKAKTKLAAASTPTPEPQPPRPTPVPVPVPVPVQPAAPSIDPALRQQVTGEINNARGRMAAAQQRKATAAPQFAQATQALADANTRNATARSNDDLRGALASAQNAALLFDAAAAPAAVATNTPPPPPSRPTTASTLVLGDAAKRVRSALQFYFNGDFEDAERAFKSLSVDMPTNGWIYAFLGASQYSVYAFETDPNYKSAAMESFRMARRYGKFRNGLPQKYFSRRIRKAFELTAAQ